MLFQVDKSETHFIQKITNQDRTRIIRYQTVPVGAVGNSGEVAEFGTLHDAREHAGLGVPVVSTKDKPVTKKRKAKKSEKAA